jgi:2,3-bisphosphoglycerate-independent phosphoglycerate mutase
MLDFETGEPFTEHTLNPVPFCLVSRDAYELKPEGCLGDIAPTVLDLMGVEQPEAMTGKSLLIKKK